MRVRPVILKLLIVAAVSYVGSYVACQEGYAHDQSGLCVIDPFLPPPFLGFEYWGQVGIALAVAASGIVVAIFKMSKD
jgi:hypothetical protein